MRPTNLLPSLALSAVVMFAPGIARAVTYHVYADSTGDFPTIQEAIYACAETPEVDSVLVGPGVHTALWKDRFRTAYNNIVIDAQQFPALADSGVVVKSIDGPEFTFLDADIIWHQPEEGIEGSRRCGFLYGCNATTAIIGFTIRGGYDASSTSAGILIQGGSPRIEDCVFKDLYGGAGGSVLVNRPFGFDPPAPLITNCLFDHSYTCCGVGGAIFIDQGCEPQILNNVFDSDSTLFAGAALAISGSAGVIAGNTFSGNKAANGGGGLAVIYGADPDIHDNVFMHNEGNGPGGNGGAVLFLRAAGDFHHNIIMGNVSEANGGAIYIDGASSLDETSPVIRNCSIIGNTGALGASAIHVTDIDFGASQPVFENVLVSSNLGSGAVHVVGTSTVTFSGSNFFANEGGDFVGTPTQVGASGNQAVDPLFCPGDEPGLQDCSPLVAEGVVLIGAPVEICPCEEQPDLLAPDLTIRILQNPVLSRQIDVYVASSESLAATPLVYVREQRARVREVGDGSRVYRGSYLLPGAGTIGVSATGLDPAGNEGSASTEFSCFPVGREGGSASTPDGAVMLDVPAGALDQTVYITLHPGAAAARGAGVDDAGEARLACAIGPAGLPIPSAVVRIDLDAAGIPESEMAGLGVFVEEGGVMRAVESRRIAGTREITATIATTGRVELRETADHPAVVIPAGLALRQNTPNPFAGGTTIRFDLPRAARVTLRVYDPAGRLVRTLADGEMTAGSRQFTWDGRDDAGRRAAPGVYSYRLGTSEGADTRKMILLR